MQENNGGLMAPDKILEQLGISDNMQIADFGSGSGYFTIPMAKMVGPQGKIYAIDVIKDALEAVSSKSQLENISNVITIHCNLEILGSSKLGNNSIDLVLMRNILFQSDKKSEIIKEAKRVLSQDGQLVLIEWIAGATLAPKKGWLVSKEEAQQLIEAEGLFFDRELNTDNQHYGLVFKK